MHVDGQCHCGKIAYEAEVDPARSAICNCTDCQTFSGSPWRASAPATSERFRLIRGTPKTYVKTADSGAKRVQAFCGDCGSAIYSTTVENPTIFNLRLGALKQRAELPPKRQIWMDSALPWARDITGVPGVPRGEQACHGPHMRAAQVTLALPRLGTLGAPCSRVRNPLGGPHSGGP